MKQHPSLKKNVIYQTSYQLLQVITPLITSPYISRILGAERIGVYNYCFSTAYLFGIFSLLGVENYGNRSIAKCAKENIIQRSRVFFEILRMQLLSSTVILILYASYIRLFMNDYRVYFYIELLYLLSISLDISWFYFGIEEFRTTALRSGSIKLISIILILTLVKSESDLGVYTVIMAGGNLASSIVLWIFLRGKIEMIRVPFTSIKKHIFPNLLLFIPVVSLALFHYMDKIMLGSLSSMEELGYYSNADKVVNIPLGIIYGLGTVMMPRISSLVKGNDEKSINQYINKSIVYCMWIGSAICFGIIGVATDFVPFFFGKGYDRCVDLLMVFAPVILIKAWSNIFRMQFLIPHGMDKEYNISVIIAAVVNVVFNLITIPYWGAVGAVAGTLLSELVVAVSYTYFSKKSVSIHKSVYSSLCFIAFGIIMLLFIKISANCLLFLNTVTRLVIEIFLGAVIYLLLSKLYFSKTNNKNMVDYLIIRNK